MASSIVEVTPSVQHYNWGVHGEGSVVGRLHGGKLDATEPYAELWIGHHPSAPNKVDGGFQSVADFAAKHKEFFGTDVDATDALPFLLKVLAVATPLSIQAHPDAQTAKRLHNEQPNIYKDAHHKPEMAVALTKFEALCGFKTWKEIAEVFNQLPELCAIVGEAFMKKHEALFANPDAASAEAASAALRDAFGCFVQSDEAALQPHYRSLLHKDTHVQEFNFSPKMQEQIRLFAKLHAFYPGDSGCLAAFLLNHVFLQPGEAMAIGPNVLHAYLHGDCIECMANSDNVIRGGLTPKLKDVNLLLNTLAYVPSQPNWVRPVSVQSSADVSITGNCTLDVYRSGFEEFEILKLQLPSAAGAAINGALSKRSATAVVVLEGTVEVTCQGVSKTLSQGKCALLKRGVAVSIRPVGETPALVFGATKPPAGDSVM